MRTLITSTSAAIRLRMRTAQVEKMARDGLIPSVRLPNGELRFDTADLDRWIDSRKNPSTETTMSKLEARLERLQKTFGRERGLRYFQRDLTFDQALAERRAELGKEIEGLDGLDSDEQTLKADLTPKIGKNLAAVAASIKMPSRQT